MYTLYVLATNRVEYFNICVHQSSNLYDHAIGIWYRVKHLVSTDNSSLLCLCYDPLKLIFQPTCVSAYFHCVQIRLVGPWQHDIGGTLALSVHRACYLCDDVVGIGHWVHHLARLPCGVLARGTIEAVPCTKHLQTYEVRLCYILGHWEVLHRTGFESRILVQLYRSWTYDPDKR